MTQALAMQHMLESAGHEVCAALVGTSPRREIPSFFLERIGVGVERYLSPNFTYDADNRGILIGRTMWESSKDIPRFLGSFKTFKRALDAHRPDLILNFYEPLFGLYDRLGRVKHPSACVAHQCLSLHPEFPFPEGRRRDRFLLRILTRITVGRSRAVLALSFTSFPDMSKGRIHVVPPILRAELFGQDVTDGNYLLIYIMSDGYAADIIEWHERNPSVPLHCFWDRRHAPETDRRDETLTLHRISDTRFLNMMAGCRGLVTTAGFESVCEAMYLGKPVLMVPVQGHYEQVCNAIDGERAGAGIRSDRFEMDTLMDYLPTHRPNTEAFRNWVDSAAERIVPLLESAAERG
jgi:uncharacterized protein (TIGR00661 family)